MRSKTEVGRKELARFGKRGQLVRVIVERGLVRMLWYVNGQPRFDSQPDTAKNRKAMVIQAEAYATELRLGTVRSMRMTVRQLWERFAESEFATLRPRSRQLYRDYWSRFELFVGAATMVDQVSAATLAECRAALIRQGLAVSTQKHVIEKVRMVWSWAVRMGLLAPSTVQMYRFKTAKEDRTEALPEYGRDEWLRILATMDPRSVRYWRPYVALALCGLQGARQNSVLHLDVKDIILEPGQERIRWQARWDKMGKDWEQPLLENAIAVIKVALEWREKLGYTGPWLLFGDSAEGIYTIQSLWFALRAAEKRGGVKRLPGRAGHGLRRLLSGDIAAITKDPVTAMHAINDTGLGQASRYIRPRDTQVRDALVARERDLGALPNLHPNRTRDDGAENAHGEVVGTTGVAECARLDSNQELGESNDSAGGRPSGLTPRFARPRTPPIYLADLEPAPQTAPEVHPSTPTPSAPAQPGEDPS